MGAIAGSVLPSNAAKSNLKRGIVRGGGSVRQRWGVWPGAALSALAFSVVHGIPLLVPAITALGVVLALVYERRGSLLAPWIMHGVFNGTVTVALFAANAAGLAL